MRTLVGTVVAGVGLLIVCSLGAQPSTTSPTNMRYNAEGTGNVLTIPEQLFWPVGVCEAGSAWATDWHFGTVATNAPSPQCKTAAPTVSIASTLDFDDAATEYIYREFWLPSDWTGTVALDFLWFTSATTGNVVWQAQTFCNAVGEATDETAFTYNAANTVTDAAQGTTFRLNSATIASVTTTGCAAGELLHLKVFRNPANASDTIAATAALQGVQVTYRRAI